MRGKRKRKDAGVLSADEGFSLRGGGADGLSVDEAFGAAYAEETAAAGAAPAARGCEAGGRMGPCAFASPWNNV